jgi:hypothetical protein
MSPDAKGENFCGRRCNAFFQREKAAIRRSRLSGTGRVFLDESCPTAASTFLHEKSDRPPVDLLGGKNAFGGRLEPGLAWEIIGTECGQTSHGVTFPPGDEYVPSVPVDDFSEAGTASPFSRNSTQPTRCMPLALARASGT